MHVRPAKTEISLGIRPVWSESLLCAQWVAKDPKFLHADNEDWSVWADWANAQADLSLRWAHTHFVGFVMSRLTWSSVSRTCVAFSHAVRVVFEPVRTHWWEAVAPLAIRPRWPSDSRFANYHTYTEYRGRPVISGTISTAMKKKNMICTATS